MSHYELITPVNLTEDAAETNYRRGIRNMVRGLWSGALDINQAWEMGHTTIRFGLTQAWNAGLKSVGVLPSEQTPQERIELTQIITREQALLFPFLEDIEKGSKANKGKLGPQFKRGEMWANRAGDVESRARLSVRTDPKLEWAIDITKANCSTCLKLDKKVKRKSTWVRLNIHPRQPDNPNLVCRGWLCGCTLLPTTKPLSRGRLPNVP